MREYSRRQALVGALAAPPAVAMAMASDTSAIPGGPSRTLVAFFSRTGNTRVIAGQIRRAHQADLFAIEPASPYPEDYHETVRQAERERRAGYQPPLAAAIPNLRDYEVVFLGFPIWGMTAPAVIGSFLSGHTMAGKTLVPFITHGGYGVGTSLDEVAKHASGARLGDVLALRQDQERETLAQVTRWLEKLEGGR